MGRGSFRRGRFGFGWLQWRRNLPFPRRPMLITGAAPSGHGLRIPANAAHEDRAPLARRPARPFRSGMDSRVCAFAHAPAPPWNDEGAAAPGSRKALISLEGSQVLSPRRPECRAQPFNSPAAAITSATISCTFAGSVR